MGLFGSSGIRGLANEKITPELALQVGKAVGSLYPRCVIGRDPRTTGPFLERALVAGIGSVGGRVGTIGIVSTPTLAHSARNSDCGIMITASHNPAPYNGIKLFNPDGSGFGVKASTAIEELIADPGNIDLVGWDEVSPIEEMADAVEEHIKAMLDASEPVDCKLVVDCGNGGASLISPYFLRRLGAGVISLNAHPDGHFPARDPEPVAENLSTLCHMVKHERANLGLAHDGDADRVMAVDENGRCLTGDEMLALFVAREAKTKAIVPVDASLVVEEVAKGVEIIRTRVGDVYISPADHENEFGHTRVDHGTYDMLKEWPSSRCQ